MPSARDIFETELSKRGIAFSPPDKEGLYRVQTDRGEVIVNLENIARDYQRDGDPKSVIHFVDRVLKTSEFPRWEIAQSLVYFSAEPSDYDFRDTIRETISDKVCRVLVLTDVDEGKVTWLTPSSLSRWGVTRAQVEAAASNNMNRLLDGKRLEVEVIDGMKLGMVPITSVFKASIIFAPNFKTFVSTDLEWPVLAVLPCRDFIYVISEKDKALLDRMSAVVQREYRKSGYPITTQVLKISDEGIKAIGEFPK
jgi:hypothetical protein